MKICALTNGVMRVAYPVGGSAYKCFPSGSNLAADALTFDTVAEAAEFLIKNPTWGIRMNPGAAIIYDNIQIHR